MTKGAPSQIADLVPGVLSDVLARRTGMTIDLIAGWDDIAGPDFAACTMPEKINWPRRADETETYSPGTLVLACEGHKAIFVQHSLPQLIDRLNHFFGYEAVNRIRLVQKPLHKPQRRHHRQSPHLDQSERERLEAVLGEIEDEKLREKLRRMGEGVIARRRQGRQSGNLP